MKTYAITIRATVTKTITVEADNEDDAMEQAHELFSVLCDDIDEDYNEEVIDFEEIKE